ncbi:phosphatidylglycerol lysyltransferase domain-containing protein [Streptomyces sp. NPDC093089]|uniref:phosphatidylglycerol lysyltransferase domain-containing protein n=1 Tax=Streptomyces sp. NPDC093089 TaxID=3366024 RepID=UPI00380515E7
MRQPKNLGYEDFKALLTDFGAAHIDSYVNAPLYYLLTGRRGAWVYRSRDACVVTCCHPHLDDCIMVFPEVGADPDHRLTASVLRQLGASETDVRLVRYTAEDLEKLTARLAADGEPITVEVVPEDVMDWRYPVRVLDTARVSALEGSTFVKIRNKYKRAADGLTVTPLRDIDTLRALRAALRFWEGTMILERKDTIGMSEFYDELFKVIEMQPDCVDGLFFQQGRRPVGFSVWEALDGKTANLYVNLCDSTVIGLSDFQLVNSCRHLAENGYSLLNMGGSELESLDSFKSKYGPAQSIDLLSAKVTYSLSRTSSDMEIHTVIEPTVGVRHHTFPASL